MKKNNLTVFLCLLLFASVTQTKGQETMSLGFAIRQAQDSTIMAFPSRH